MIEAAKKQDNFPGKWERVFLGDVSSDISYGYTASSTEEPVGPRMLRITDIQDNTVNWETVPYCKIDNKEVDKYLLSPNDIVFARTGATCLCRIKKAGQFISLNYNSFNFDNFIKVEYK